MAVDQAYKTGNTQTQGTFSFIWCQVLHIITFLTIIDRKIGCYKLEKEKKIKFPFQVL